MSVASLPMYDLEPLRNATDAWGQAVAKAFRHRGLAGVPDTLDRGAFGDRFKVWSSPDLLLSQTCGYPLTHAFADKVRLVAIPFYGAPHCLGCDYCSVILVHENSDATRVKDLRGTRVAVNGFDSQSGFNALRASVARHARDGRFFGEVIETGSHLVSARSVAEGKADVCSSDCVTHALWSRHLPDAVAGTRVLTTTQHAPNLPYVTNITRSDEEVEAMQLGLLDAVADPEFAAARALLMLVGFTMLPRSTYDRIDAMEQQAADLGYPDLA